MIGLFDSGVGGLSVLREIQHLLPNEDFVYFGDTAHVPYGEKSDTDITRYTIQAIEFLLTFRPSLIVIACNTATSVAIATARVHYPTTPMVGVVPVVKTLAQQTTTRHVAVCATAATLASSTYAQLKKDFATGINFLELALPEWVMLVERGEVHGQEAKKSVALVAEKIKDYGADVVALGSTHFPFLRPLVEEALPGVQVFDSGPAVARQVVRILTANSALPSQNKRGTTQYYCSGDPQSFSQTATHLLSVNVVGASIGQKP